MNGVVTTSCTKVGTLWIPVAHLVSGSYLSWPLRGGPSSNFFTISPLACFFPHTILIAALACIARSRSLTSLQPTPSASVPSPRPARRLSGLPKARRSKER